MPVTWLKTNKLFGRHRNRSTQEAKKKYRRYKKMEGGINNHLTNARIGINLVEHLKISVLRFGIL